MTNSQAERYLRTYFPYGFPLSREAFERFELVTLPDTAEAKGSSVLQSVRSLTHLINEKRHQETYDLPPLKTEDLVFLGLITDVLRFMARRYFFEDNPGVLTEGVKRCEDQLGGEDVARLPAVFIQLFPPRSVLRRWLEAAEFLTGDEAGLSNRDVTVVEIILLYLSVRNPAVGPYQELFDDVDLQRRSPYIPFVVGLEEFCEEQPPFGAEGISLFYFLRAPMRACPDSLAGQLEFIQQHWSQYLPANLRQQLVLAQDIWREDQRQRGLGPGPVPVLEFGQWRGEEPEPERFSQDKDWMSNVVLMAKNVHVWLDQLAKKYQCPVTNLSEVPDEELDRLAGWGFRGLWLIGVWERSRASQKIKQYMGNPEAAASAYSLYEYSIAADLGGEEAFQNLRERAWTRGIRLASDMVPNHMGLDSRWVREHPDWFIQSPHPPYPWYTFTGGDLSEDARVGLYIEDGYWQHRDAAVVFQRVDRHTGDTRYIYHGNDGTSMPWNDTAQLNYLLPEVREAVVQTILHVARQFPIIRFDAAMTLAKKHFQRLWFPQPGDAGAIPSRAEHGMNRAQFDAVFPVEFWREVVDRVASEVPETLLLAEAFWLMEGFFVRTLGMHRVYNSAFMNMLKMEENQKYRQTIKNVLAFSPEVLKRFVNFMSNPDERTAVDQFGKGDKYCGVAVLMVTMPGLPMFGHGQVEGLTEKYGMEYRKAYWDEPVDEHMVWRHEAQIFPLMRRRQLFSGAHNFAFFDFVTPEGWVDENVYAYTNRAGDERALIVYNNAFTETRGRIHTSTNINVGPADAPAFVQRNLAEALGLNTSDGCWYAFRDYRTGLEYLRTGREFAAEGLAVLLQAYQYHAFLDFREIRDDDGSWVELAGHLAGRGTPSLDTARQEMLLDQILAPLEQALQAAPTEQLDALGHFYRSVAEYTGSRDALDSLLGQAQWELELANHPAEALVADGVGADSAATFCTVTGLTADAPLRRTALAWIAIHRLGEMPAANETETPAQLTRQRLQTWLLQKKVRDVFQHAGVQTEKEPSVASTTEPPDKELAKTYPDAPCATGDADQTDTGRAFTPEADAILVAILTQWPALLTTIGASPETVARQLFADPTVREYLGVNQHSGVWWFNQERFERLTSALLFTAAAEARAEVSLAQAELDRLVSSTRQLRKAAKQAGYRLEETITALTD